MQPMSRALADPASVGIDPERLDLFLRRFDQTAAV